MSKVELHTEMWEFHPSKLEASDTSQDPWSTNLTSQALHDAP